MKMEWHFIWKVNVFIIISIIHVFFSKYNSIITIPLLEYDGGIIVEIEAPFYDDPPPPFLEKGMKIL